MNSSYLPLTQIIFEHTYFEKTPFTGFSFQPVDATKLALINHGILWKKFPGRVSLVFNSSFANHSRSREQALVTEIVLRLLVTIDDPYFQNYTENIPVEKDLVLYLSNKHSPEDAGSRKELHSTSFVEVGDFRPLRIFFPPPRNPYSDSMASNNSASAQVTTPDLSEPAMGSIHAIRAPFGILDLAITPNLLPEYQISFQSRISHWRYIVVSEHLRTLNNLAVIDPIAGKKFDGPETITLPDSRQALSFTSSDPVTMAASHENFFQLVEEDGDTPGKQRVLIKALPTPDERVVSFSQPSETRQPDKYISEIFVY